MTRRIPDQLSHLHKLSLCRLSLRSTNSSVRLRNLSCPLLGISLILSLKLSDCLLEPSVHIIKSSDLLYKKHNRYFIKSKPGYKIISIS